MVLFINYIEFPLVIYSLSFISCCQVQPTASNFSISKKSHKISHNVLGTFVTEQMKMSPPLETISCSE